MNELFGIPLPQLYGQILLGLVNGSFYAILSLGLAVIFGMLNVVNFSHGALYMLGAYAAYGTTTSLGYGYVWGVLAGVGAVALMGLCIERALLRQMYRLDPVYGLLLTFGITLVVEGVMRSIHGVSGQRVAIPETFRGVTDLGFMTLPNYRAYVVVASVLMCAAVWFVIERTRLGAYLRAATENPQIVETFGINVPRMVTLTFGFGCALAGFAGVLAAPVTPITPMMGSNLVIVVFAVVVIGGMGSMLGSIVTGLGLGLVEGLTKVFWPEASLTVIFFIMAIVLLVRPAGLFGKEA
jgi:branched-chain amino acid transport system permease protein